MMGEKAPRWRHGAAGETNVGAVISRCHVITSAPYVASGSLRACLAAFIAQAEARREVDTDPTRRRKLAQLLRALTHALARALLREVGR